MLENILYFFALGLLGLPVPLLAIAWSRWYGTRKIPGGHKASLLILGITTLSYLFSLLGLALEDVVGPYYSTRGIATIYANMALMVAITLFTAFTRSSLRRVLLLGIAAVVLVWAYLAVVSSAV